MVQSVIFVIGYLLRNIFTIMVASAATSGFAQLKGNDPEHEDLSAASSAKYDGGVSSRDVTGRLRDHGIKCDGSDETAAWSNLFASMHEGGTITLPVGRICGFTSLNVPAHVSIDGGSRSSTVLRNLSNTTDGIRLNNGSSLRHVALDSIGLRKRGAFVITSANGTVVSDVQCIKYFICYEVAGLSATQRAVAPVLENILAFHPAIGAGSCFAIFKNYSSAIVDKIVATGTEAGVQPDCGMKFINGDTAFVSNSNVTRHGTGLFIESLDKTNAYATYVSNSIFDGAGTISNGTIAQSCLLYASGTGGIYETSLSSIWCGLSGSDGFLANAYKGGVIDTLTITAAHFDGNVGSGFHINGNTRNWSFTGGSSSANKDSGIYISGETPANGVVANVNSGTTHRGTNHNFGLKLSGGVALKFESNSFFGKMGSIQIIGKLHNIIYRDNFVDANSASRTSNKH